MKNKSKNKSNKNKSNKNKSNKNKSNKKIKGGSHNNYNFKRPPYNRDGGGGGGGGGGVIKKTKLYKSNNNNTQPYIHNNNNTQPYIHNNNNPNGAASNGAALNRSNQNSASSKNQYTYIENRNKTDFYIDGVKVGFAIYGIYPYKEDVIFIQTIYVEENARGKSIGKSILKHVLNKAFSNKSIQSVLLTDETQSAQYNPTKIPNDMYAKSGFIFTHPGSRDPNKMNEMVLTRNIYETKTSVENYLNEKYFNFK